MMINGWWINDDEWMIWMNDGLNKDDDMMNNE